MKNLRTEPGAKRLMESLRNMGYEYTTAIADLIDNSIVADASEIHIDIIPRVDSFHPAVVVIADNGNGMSKEELQQSMRFGSFQEYSYKDLGKYGLGMKTASLSQCRVLTVSSKAKSSAGLRPRRHTMRWDVDYVAKTNDWNLMLIEDSELEPWEKDVIENNSSENESGTVITWSRLDGPLSILSSLDTHNKEQFLAEVIEEVSQHLSMIFHRFMLGTVTGRRKLNIYVCGDILEPWDPFCRDEKTTELPILNMPVTFVESEDMNVKGTLTISPYILPREDEFSSPSLHKKAAGPKKWNRQQGFYFYRNNRLIQSGGWSRILTVEEHLKLLRIALDFSGELDKAFSVNITKMKASIPVELCDRISKYLAKWILQAKQRYNHKSHEEDIENVSNVENDSNSNEDNVQPASNVNDDYKIVKKNVESETLVSIESYFENISPHDLRSFSSVLMHILEDICCGNTKPEEVPIDLIKKMYKEGYNI